MAKTEEAKEEKKYLVWVDHCDNRKGIVVVGERKFGYRATVLSETELTEEIKEHPFLKHAEMERRVIGGAGKAI
mgnify:CR=1 FL=1